MGRKLKNSIELAEIAKALHLPFVGENIFVNAVAALSDAKTGNLSFAKNADWVKKAPPGVALLCRKDDATSGHSLIFSDNPRLDFARALTYLENQVGFEWSVAAPAVHPSAKIGRNVVLGDGVSIGQGSVIAHNVVIGPEVVIGDFCTIKSGAVIGEEGFGFERDSVGRAVRLPHVGSVKIGNNVEVGSLTTVCRGTLGLTTLADGCKIDDHVHIAHNVYIGEDAFVIACAEVSGGVRIGARAWIAPNAALMNQIDIGPDAVVGIGATVLKNVEANSVVVGNPAKPMNKK